MTSDPVGLLHFLSYCGLKSDQGMGVQSCGRSVTAALEVALVKDIIPQHLLENHTLGFVGRFRDMSMTLL